MLAMMSIFLILAVISSNAGYDTESCKGNTILKMERVCDNDDIRSSENANRKYELEIIECSNDNIHLKLLDSVTKSNYFSISDQQHRQMNKIATSRQFINLLKSAVDDDDNESLLDIKEQKKGNNDIIVNVILFGNKQMVWDIDVISMIFTYELKTLSEYASQLNALSLQVSALEKEVKRLTEENSKLQQKQLSVVEVQCKPSSFSHGGLWGVCTAKCPQEFVLISGSCYTDTSWWVCSTSKREDNGWTCGCGADSNQKVRNRGMIGYAYCAKI